ncbi:MAG: DUF433 domain-containing protein [Bacteroidetes bacterium]|nr:DUF433 domain-containing protein [Bacteroidota bacterium]
MRTIDEHIEVTLGIVGGKPRIAGHRITVQNIVIWYDRMGRSADEIATEYELGLADVHAALAYYFDHRIEIDESIEESENFLKTIRKNSLSKLEQTMQISNAACKTE